jgi:DNA topoisomerase-3
MTFTVYLAEKPSFGRVLAEALELNNPGTVIREKHKHYIKSDEWAICWLAGHAYELFSAKDYSEDWNKYWSDLPLPLIPTEFRFKPIEGEFINNCRNFSRRLIDKATCLVICTDAGVEGQVIGEIFLQENNWKGQTKRLWCSSTESTSVAKSLKNLRDNSDPFFQGMKNSGMARIKMDWLIGINFTIAYTNLANAAGYSFLASAGRVQSCLLSIAVDHEKMIDNFKHSGYFTVKATLATTDGEMIEAELVIPPNLKDDKGHCTDEKALQGIIQRCSKTKGFAKSIEEHTTKHSPPVPYDLTTLCIKLSNTHNITSTETTKLYQAMYESGILTYTRTEDTFYQDEQLANIDKVFSMLKNIDEEFSKAIEGANTSLMPKCFNSSKIVEHPANSVTSVSPKWSGLDQKSKIVYREVANRMIEQFYPDFITASTQIVLDIGGQTFIAKGKKTIQKGWSQVTGIDPDEQDSSIELPNVVEGDILSVASIETLSKKTRAPSRLTEASLLTIMKNSDKYLVSQKTLASLKQNSSLGTAATRPGAINLLVNTRKFLNLKPNGIITATKLGKTVRSILPDELASPDLSAMWELQFDSIKKSRLDPNILVDQTKVWVTKKIGSAKGLHIKPNPLCFPCTAENCPSIMKRVTNPKSNTHRWVCIDRKCNTTIVDDGGKPLVNLPNHGQPCSKCKAPLVTRLRNKTKMQLADIRKTKEFRYLICCNSHYN